MQFALVTLNPASGSPVNRNLGSIECEMGKWGEGHLSTALVHCHHLIVIEWKQQRKIRFLERGSQNVSFKFDIGRFSLLTLAHKYRRNIRSAGQGLHRCRIVAEQPLRYRERHIAPRICRCSSRCTEAVWPKPLKTGVLGWTGVLVYLSRKMLNYPLRKSIRF